MKKGGGRGLTWMRWERLCIRKEHGGMGFRDFYGFNLAMIYKAKYFPHGDFLSAKLGDNPSMVWRDDANRFIESERVSGFEDLRVCELFVPGEREWFSDLVEGLFSERDANEIMSIALCPTEQPDQRIWSFSKNGEYTVRSGYRVVSDRLIDRTSLHVTGQWEKLWGVAEPPKLKVMVWRVAQNVIPTRLELQRRHIAVPHSCGTCGTEIENLWHLPINCTFAAEVWDKVGLGAEVYELAEQSESIAEWIFKVIQTLPEEKCQVALAVV
ncbi:Putative ribonuclease H protein At1g65750 [Linum perenne]